MARNPVCLSLSVRKNEQIPVEFISPIVAVFERSSEEFPNDLLLKLR